VRFYFSTHKRGYGGYRITTNPNDPPQTLELVHVRTPPSSLAPPNAPPTGGNAFQQGGSTKGNWNPTSLGPSEYSSGLLVAAQSHPGETDPDTLLCVAPDIPSIAQLNKATPSTNPNAGMAMSQTYGQGYGSSVAPYGSNKPLLTELPTLLSIPGRTWAISPLSAASKPTPSATSGWNELLTQSTAPPLQFLILTNEGISVVVKKRAVDCLKELIEREGSRRGVGGEGGELVKGFLERFA
jgi:nuclear pore complex protein Nup155